MNLKEGTRRLALLSVILGVILSTFVSYSSLEANHEERKTHTRLDEAANSEEAKLTVQ
jgi:hypothetical protein